MSETEIQIPDKGSRQCWACKSDLSQDQSFCIECKNWQSWRKYINFSTAMITALTLIGGALVTTGGAILTFLDRQDTVPIMSGAFTITDESTVRLEVVNLEETGVLFVPEVACNHKYDESLQDYNAYSTYYTQEATGVGADEKAVFNFRMNFSIEDKNATEIVSFEDDYKWECKIHFSNGSDWILAGEVYRSQIPSQSSRITRP